MATMVQASQGLLDTFRALSSSRKAVLLFLVTAAMFALVMTGKLPVEKFTTFLMVTLPAWMASQAWEDGQKNKAPDSVSTTVHNYPAPKPAELPPN